MQTRDFLDKAIVVFPMAFVLMLGEIDISVCVNYGSFQQQFMVCCVFDAGVSDD